MGAAIPAMNQRKHVHFTLPSNLLRHKNLLKTAAEQKMSSLFPDLKAV